MTDIEQTPQPNAAIEEPLRSDETRAPAAVPGQHGPLKKEPVTTILAYLSGRTGASTFLKHLRDAGVWSFADDDRAAAIGRHRELDPRFTKTATLLANSLRAKDERHVLPVSEVARLALLDRLRDYPHWLGTEWDELSPEQRAFRVADAVSRKFTDAKKGREAQNLLSTALLLLSQDSLDSETALRATVRALDARAEVTPRWNRERVLFVAGPRSKLPELRLALQTVLPWMEKADASEMALAEAVAAVEVERRRSETAESNVRSGSEQIRALEAERESLESRIADLEDELRSSHVLGSHSLDQTRSSARAFLEGRVLGLLTTATEALDLDPPRPHIAREKLDVVREAIEEQLKWLAQ